MPKPIFDYSKLSGKIIEVCGTRENFAKQMGIGVGTLSGKLKGKYPFTQDEIRKLAHYYQENSQMQF